MILTGVGSPLTSMDIEYEAKFLNIDKRDIRRRLKNAGAILVRPEYLQKRIPFYLPEGERSKDAWVRVRDEGDKITVSYKVVNGNKIHNQREICLVVSDFEKAVELLKALGCRVKSYQESKRELWKLSGVEITIDEWPFLEPFVEVEGKSAAVVKRVSEKIGFDYADALFCAVGELYRVKYDIPQDKINTAPRVVFNMRNPFKK